MAFNLGNSGQYRAGPPFKEKDEMNHRERANDLVESILQDFEITPREGNEDLSIDSLKLYVTQWLEGSIRCYES